MKSERRPRASASGRHPYLLLAAALALALASTLTLVAAPRVAAAGPTFTVTGTADTIDAATNCAGVDPATLTASPGPDGVVSLREAICAANKSTGATIAFAAGTNGTPIVLALSGADDGANDADTGDLDLTQSMTITGNGAANTIIDGGGTSRLFDTFTSSTAITVAISGVTLQNGNVAANDSFVSAGAIFISGGDAMSISNSVIKNNQAINDPGFGANGGAIDSQGTLTLDTVTLSGNHATFQGGAINSTGALTVQNSTITNNTAAFGGGIFTNTNNGIATTITNTAITSNHATDTTGGPITAGGGIDIGQTDGQVTVTGSTITGNQTLGNGGGVAFSATAANTGSLTMGFNRVAGNTVGATGSGTGLFTNNTGTVTAQHNWWGCNAGPGSAPCDRVAGPAAAAYTPWLTLGFTASPTTITTSQTSTLTASFLKDSAGNAVSAGNLTALVGVSVAFGNAQKGAVAPASATITTAGTATTTFTPNAAGAGSADATVDSQTVTANLTITAPPAITTADNATFTVGQFGTFTVTATGTTPLTLSETGALPTGVTFVDNGGGNATLAGTPAAGTAGIYPLTIKASNGIVPDATQSFTLTVDQAPTITSPNATTFTVGAAGTFTVAASGFPPPTLTASGALPTGVTFTAATGVLAGTPAAGTGGAYALTFTAKNGVAPDATQTFTLTVNEAPAVTTQPTDQRACVGASVTFTAAASGFPAPTVQWQVSTDNGTTFTDIGGATGPALTFATTASESGNQYRA
ncbi:MAG TPA: putative Ig domain-containing protein, partial [Thermomicrobiales bacterium]|nr:putative Ig domain-containing protein [Thermomicrobiales bacterium]